MFRKTFKAFQYRDFRILWIGACTSSIGTWMQQMAQAWLVLDISKSPFLLGLDAFLGNIPIFLFSLVGGVIADRIDRRYVLLGSQYVQMACALVLTLLLAIHKVQVWHIAVFIYRGWDRPVVRRTCLLRVGAEPRRERRPFQRYRAELYPVQFGACYRTGDWRDRSEDSGRDVVLWIERAVVRGCYHLDLLSAHQLQAAAHRRIGSHQHETGDRVHPQSECDGVSDCSCILDDRVCHPDDYLSAGLREGCV